MKKNAFKIPIIILICLIQIEILFAQGTIQPKDSVAKQDTIQIIANKEDSKYVPLSEFKYADSPYYTLTGKPALKESDIKLIPSLALAGVYTGIFIAQHEWQLNTIWQEQAEFKFEEDGKYSLYSDKGGHFFGGYYTSYVMSQSLMVAGFSWDAATTWGSVMGLAYTTYVEILDGYGEHWGFSPSDWYADIAGASFFLAQHYVPYLQNITPKFSYIPADKHGERRRTPHESFIDDYSSQTVYISFNIHNMLPKPLKSYWPTWLELSVGFAARNLCDRASCNCDCSGAAGKWYSNGAVYGSPRYILALDYNLKKMLPDGGWFWNWLKQSLDNFKLPSPAIEFSPQGTKFYLVYPFYIVVKN